MTKKICLTFDIEDWFQTENMRSVFPPETWDDQELRVEKNTYRILELLDEHKIKATFFILGWIAERVPQLVKVISEQGHEIASHGYNHILNYKLTEVELKNDLESSKKLLEDLSGHEIIGYRAPTFSITDQLLFLLKKLGYEYDSSFNDFAAHDRYGKIEKAEGSRIFEHESGILEIPMPLMDLFGKKVPISGGGYFRFLPFPLFKKLVFSYIRDNDYYVFYFHPWELDEKQPKMTNISLFDKIRQYIGIKKTWSKLNVFLKILIEEYKLISFSKLGELAVSNKQETI